MRAIVVPRRYVRLLLFLNPIVYCLIFAIMQINGGESPFITTTPATTYRCILRSLHVSGFMRRRFPLPMTDTKNSDLTAAIECSYQRSCPRDPEGRIPTAITISMSSPLLGGSIYSSLPGDRIHLWHDVPMGGHGEHVSHRRTSYHSNWGFCVSSYSTRNLDGCPGKYGERLV